MARPARSLYSRFIRKVLLDCEANCWEWTGGKAGIGYGTIHQDGRGTVRAHRVSFELFNGPIPDGLCVLHRCDNPGCVNPTHLFLGDHQDNMADRDAKERTLRGRKHPRAKLTESDVRTIHQRLADGYTQNEIAESLGVTQAQISHISRGHQWSHLKEKQS